LAITNYGSIDPLTRRVNTLDIEVNIGKNLPRKGETRMKIFLDTAEVNEIRQGVQMGMVDGVTTNPSLVAKSGKPFKKVIEEICKIVDGPISAEAISQDAKGMLKEARELSEIHKNIVVKIPMGVEGLKAARACADLGIKTNVTLIFQPIQGLLAAKAGASYVSPFVGRLDDVSQEGMSMVSDLLTMLSQYDYLTEVIVASIRHPIHVVQSALMGAHVVTIPFSVLQNLVKHPLTDIGIKKFLDDYKKIPKK
jgi:transaldolase